MGISMGISPQNMARNMVRLRTSMYWILEFPLSIRLFMMTTKIHRDCIIYIYIKPL